MTDAGKKNPRFKDFLIAFLDSEGEGGSYLDSDPESRFALVEKAFIAYDSITGGSSPIVPAPQYLLDLVNATNHIVSFILDDTTHFGTGILVGPGYVLTASHLFFERQTRRLIDSNRLKRITVEVQTTLIGSSRLAQGGAKTSALYQPDTNNWLVDPPIKDGVAQRELFNLDFAIVKLDKALGDDEVGTVKRGWFEIATADAAELLTANLGFRVFEFLDRGTLLTSAGFVHKVNPNGMRFLHTASTAGSSSGAPLLSDEGNLIGIHVSGCPSDERPKFNRAIPIRRIAEIIDKPDENGETIRHRINP